MSVLDVFNIPGTPAELAQWSFLHTALHRSEIQAVFRQKHLILTEFVLDPIDTTSNSAWFQQHQQMHDDVDQATGVAQFNLIDVDWSDDGQRLGWFQSHAQLHQQETNALETFS